LQGRYYFVDGAKFTGVFADSNRPVNGKYKAKGWTYEGSFNNGTFDWLGMLEFSCLGKQCRYDGKFENGLFQGQGCLTICSSEPKIYKGVWN